MAAMTTVLTEFSDKDNSRTYTISGHSATRPRLVIQKRTIPGSSTGVAETIIQVLRGTVDSDGAPINAKVLFEAKVRYPINIGSTETDIASALATFRDIVAGDEFASTVTTQGYLE
jgi:hypothetical protein